MTITAHAATLPEWRWLADRGWRIEAHDAGSNQCDARNRRILVRRHVMTRPGVRHRRYVLPHEIGHAVHAELLGYQCDALMAARGLDRRSAVEVVADAWCLAITPTRAMRTWVRASVAWHGRHGYRYRWADVRSPEAQALVALLRAAIR